MITELQYQILAKLYPPTKQLPSGNSYKGLSKLEALLGSDFIGRIQGKTVIDFGCGEGAEAVEMARKGAGKVIGVDIREEVLQVGRAQAAAEGLQDKCTFTTVSSELADIVVSLDAFEHFDDPAAILRIIYSLMKPDGEALFSFGPTWYHPLGGHLFSVFPWSHILFREQALIRWRADHRNDGATRFGEVSGGLNQMTIKRFEQLVVESSFHLASLTTVPIGKLRAIHCGLTREFTTSIVRCRLARPPA